MITENNTLLTYLKLHPDHVFKELQTHYNDEVVPDFVGLDINATAGLIRRIINKTTPRQTSDFSKNLNLRFIFHSSAQRAIVTVCSEQAVIANKHDVFLNSVFLNKVILRCVKQEASKIVGLAPVFVPTDCAIDFEIQPEDVKGIFVEKDQSYSIVVCLGVPENLKLDSNNFVNTTANTEIINACMPDLSDIRVFTSYFAALNQNALAKSEVNQIEVSTHYAQFISTQAKLRGITEKKFVQHCLDIAGSAMGIPLTPSSNKKDDDEFVNG